MFASRSRIFISLSRRLSGQATASPMSVIAALFGEGEGAAGGDVAAAETRALLEGSSVPSGAQNVSTRLLLSSTSISRGPVYLRKPEGYPPPNWSLEETWKAMQALSIPALPDREHTYFKVPLRRLGSPDWVVGEVQLHRGVFGERLRKDILARVVKFQRNAVRRGTSSGKNRGEVRGGGKKPRPQKHTGRSRQGSIRAPQWRHGGKAHPPKPRDYSTSLQKKVRALGLKVALSQRLREGRLQIFENPVFDTASTNDLAEKLKQHDWRRVLFILGDDVDANFFNSARNIPSIRLQSVLSANVYDILVSPNVCLTPRAVQQLHYRFLIPPFILSSWSNVEESKSE